MWKGFSRAGPVQTARWKIPSGFRMKLGLGVGRQRGPRGGSAEDGGWARARVMDRKHHKADPLGVLVVTLPF